VSVDAPSLGPFFTGGEPSQQPRSYGPGSSTEREVQCRKDSRSTSILQGESNFGGQSNQVQTMAWILQKKAQLNGSNGDARTRVQGMKRQSHDSSLTMVPFDRDGVLAVFKASFLCDARMPEQWLDSGCRDQEQSIAMNTRAQRHCQALPLNGKSTILF
jgi:hypothetical protein